MLLISLKHDKTKTNKKKTQIVFFYLIFSPERKVYLGIFFIPHITLRKEKIKIQY